MEATIWFVLGIVATIIVSRYYFLRTIDKRLVVLRLFESRIFAGIAPDVRKELHFKFRDKEVQDLQQLVLVVANQGERAIRDIIEPMTLSVPIGIEILDAAIAHRRPEVLKASISIKQEDGKQSLSFDFPLLNKGEHFVVKLLVSGTIDVNKTYLSILVDDVPRTLKIQSPKPGAIVSEKEKYQVRWSDFSAVLVVFGVLSWIVFVVYQLYRLQPFLFPIPWASYQFSIASLLLVVPAVAIIAMLVMLCFSGFVVAMNLEKIRFFKSKKIVLPPDIQGVGFPYWLASSRATITVESIEK